MFFNCHLIAKKKSKVQIQNSVQYNFILYVVEKIRGQFIHRDFLELQIILNLPRNIHILEIDFFPEITGTGIILPVFVKVTEHGFPRNLHETKWLPRKPNQNLFAGIRKVPLLDVHPVNCGSTSLVHHERVCPGFQENLNSFLLTPANSGVKNWKGISWNPSHMIWEVLFVIGSHVRICTYRKCPKKKISDWNKTYSKCQYFI